MKHSSNKAYTNLTAKINKSNQIKPFALKLESLNIIIQMH